MKTLINKLPIYVSYAFILLFTYAAGSKMLDFENFQVQLAQSPLLSAYAGFISYAVIIIEVMIAGVLADPKVRQIGLYASFGLMVAFTVYIFLILNYSDFIPCSCGGILEKMSWDEHLIFNIAFVGLALTSVFMGKERAHGWSRIAAAALIAVFSAGSIGALFLSSEYMMKKENNFTRRFIPHAIKEDKLFNVGVNTYYFAGSDEKSIYLGNDTSPLLLSSIDSSFTAFNHFFIQLGSNDFRFKSPRIQVTDSYYFLYDGSVPVIYRGKLGSNRPIIVSYKMAYFTQFAILDSLRFAVRSINASTKRFNLGIIEQGKYRKVAIQPHLLDSEQFSLFDEDGWLMADRAEGSIIYFYSYQSKFMVTDYSMDKRMIYPTIDRSANKILNVKTLGNGDQRMMSPPPKVNKKTRAYRGIVFNESNLSGKYEPHKLWKNYSVIDMYSTSKQEYLGSFSIYHRGGGKMSDMLITDRYLYVIIESELIRYRLSDSIMKQFQKGEAENLQ